MFFIQNRSILLWNSVASELGGVFLTFTISTMIYIQTGSAKSLGSVWLMYYLPAFIIQLFIGPFIDKYPRKNIIAVSQLIRVVMLLGLLFLLSLDKSFLEVILVIQLVNGILTPIVAPAIQALIPSVIETANIKKMNAEIDMIRQLSVIIGPILAGMFIDVLPLNIVVWFVLLTYSMSAFLLIQLKETFEKSDVRQTWMAQFKEGIKSFLENRLVVILGIAFGFVQFAVGVSMIITIPYITESLGQTYFVYGIFQSGFPVGYIIGSLLIAKWKTKNELRLVLFSLGMGGLSYVGLAITSNITIAIIIEVLAGVFMAIFNIYYVTVTQTSFPPEILGKVSSIRLLILRVMMPLGILFATVTSGVFSVRINYSIMGILIVIASFLSYLILSKEKSHSM